MMILIYSFLALLFTIAVGMVWVLLNYYIKVELTPKCLWCGRESHHESSNLINVEECIENITPNAVR